MQRVPRRRGYPKILRKESKAVPYGNGPVPQQEEFGSGESTLADVYRFFCRKIRLTAEELFRSMGQEVRRDGGRVEKHGPACSKPRA